MGVAWDRSTYWGSSTTLDDALEIARNGPKWRIKEKPANLAVGMVVRAVRAVGGEAPGSVGVVYEIYDRDDDTKGYSIIFERGFYDGFSPNCLKICQVESSMCIIPELMSYQFVDVGELRKDFNNGLFNDAFEAGWSLIETRQQFLKCYQD